MAAALESIRAVVEVNVRVGERESGELLLQYLVQKRSTPKADGCDQSPHCNRYQPWCAVENALANLFLVRYTLLGAVRPQ